MLVVAPVRQSHRTTIDEGAHKPQGLEKLRAARSDIPAVTHVDYSARVPDSRHEAARPIRDTAAGIRGPDRVPDTHQHELQHTWRADSLHAVRCVQLLPKDEDGRAGTRAPSNQESPSHANWRTRLKQAVHDSSKRAEQKTATRVMTMHLLKINENPTPRELRAFGLLLTVFITMTGGMVHWRLEAPVAAWTVWATGMILSSIYAAVPSGRSSIYRGWCLMTFPVQMDCGAPADRNDVLCRIDTHRPGSARLPRQPDQAKT